MTPARIIPKNIFQTHSGINFDLIEPTPDMICIEDIAHSLSLQCRWGGHCHRFYSVAEHSYHVSSLLPDELALHGLLHDAAEAYVSDVITPLKNHLIGYKKIEHKILHTVFEKFNVKNITDDKRYIKYVDLCLAATEAEQITTDSVFQKEWIKTLPDPANIKIECWNPTRARDMFMLKFFRYKDTTR